MGVKVKFHKGSWWVFISHNGRRKAKAVGDRDTALHVAKRIREQLAVGDLHLKEDAVEVPVDTLNAYADGWLTGVASTLKASTVRFYTANLARHVRPSLGLRPITSLTRAD